MVPTSFRLGDPVPPVSHHRHFAEESMASYIEAEALVFDGPRYATRLVVGL
jgi:hypothetical protein